MAAPTISLPVNGTAPNQYTTRELLEAAVNGGLKGLFDGMAAQSAALRPREGVVNDTGSAPVLLRVFPSSNEAPSQYMRIWLPIGKSKWAEMLLKRNALSANEADVGLSQVTWEPDEVKVKSDALIFRVASTNLVGGWVTDTDLLSGIYVRYSSDAGAARAFTFSGDSFRFGYVEASGSSAFEIEVDGVLVVNVPAGTALARRVVTRGGFGPGEHTLIVRRAAGASGRLNITGIGVSDAGGRAREVGDFSAAVDDPAGNLLAAGVQTFVCTLDGGLRMGGGHGGTWSRAPAVLTVDGIRVPIEDTAGTYHSADEIVLSESFEMRQSAAAAPILLVTRRMTFRGCGYSCDMDVRLADPLALRDFFWAMAKFGPAVRAVEQPFTAPLDTLPIDTVSQITALSGDNYRIEVRSDGQVKSDGPDPYTSIRDSGGAKIYTIAAMSAPATFSGRQRLSYQMDFAAL